MTEDTQSSAAAPGSLQPMVLASLVQAWRADEGQCQETAAHYERCGELYKAQQLRAQACGLMRCADDVSKLLAQQNPKLTDRTTENPD